MIKAELVISHYDGVMKVRKFSHYNSYQINNNNDIAYFHFPIDDTLDYMIEINGVKYSTKNKNHKWLEPILLAIQLAN